MVSQQVRPSPLLGVLNDHWGHDIPGGDYATPLSQHKEIARERAISAMSVLTHGEADTRGELPICARCVSPEDEYNMMMLERNRPMYLLCGGMDQYTLAKRVVRVMKSIPPVKPVHFNADGHGVAPANNGGLLSFSRHPGAFLNLPEIDPSADLHVPKGLVPVLGLPGRADLEISLHYNKPPVVDDERLSRGIGHYFSEGLDLGPVLSKNDIDKIDVALAGRRVKVAQKGMAKNYRRAMPNGAESLLADMANGRFSGKLAAFNIEARQWAVGKG
jgi:hypothetical protein